MQVFSLEKPSGRGSATSGALMVGDIHGRRRTGLHARQQRLTASITAGAVLPAAAALASPAPLAGLAHDATVAAQRSLLAAVAAARTVVVARDSAAPLRRHQRSKPVAKRAAVAASSSGISSGMATLEAAPAVAATAAPAVAQAQQSRAARQFLAGGLAGAVAKTLVAPMERVSTLLMADAKRFSVAQAARHAWRNGLYRGHAATLVKIFPASAIQFSVFNSIKDTILASKQRRRQPALAAPGALLELANHERLLAGAAAGAAAASLCYPLESLRTMMSVAGGVSGNLVQAGRSVVAAHGVGALYKGFRASLLGDVMGNALGFTAYEIGNRLYREANGGAVPPPHHRGLIGTCSAAVVLTLTLPLEVVRRRLQVQGLAGRPILYRGALDCFRQVLRAEGLRGFYAASLPSYLKVAPSIGCMYFLFELFMARLTPPVPQLAAAVPAPAIVGAATVAEA